MAIFGKWGNIFKKVTSAFAYQGKTWSETWSALKELPWKTHPIKAYRSYTESKLAARLKPFYKQMPGMMTPPEEVIVRTQVRLRDKYQYLFDVQMTSSNIPGVQNQVFSIMAPYTMSKHTAEFRMKQQIEDMMRTQKYGKLTSLTVDLSEVRQSRWIK